MQDLQIQINQLKDSFLQDLPLVSSTAEIEALRVKFLGKKSELNSLMKKMGTLSQEDRPVFGKLVNEIRVYFENELLKKSDVIVNKEKKAKLSEESIDISLPGKPFKIGKLHPITQIINEINEIFLNMGFSVADGPEIEFDKYNFTRLNIPEGHPARDTQDTFYINDSVLLRTQTSPVQIRVMEEQRPPIKIVCPGKVYRSDSIDATHSPIFHQIEGLVVDKGVTMGDLIGVLQLFAVKLFGEDTKIRLRPHHFPFTEPSCEVDVTCWNCGGSGCRTCKDEGWIEVLGAGMVHAKVLEECDIDPEIYSGYAFGIGVERTAMARFGIDDIRLLYENDIRFLEQF